MLESSYSWCLCACLLGLLSNFGLPESPFQGMSMSFHCNHCHYAEVTTEVPVKPLTLVARVSGLRPLLAYSLLLAL